MDNSIVLQNDNTSGVANVANVTPTLLSFDKDVVIRRATMDYVAGLSTPVTLSDDELRDGLMIAIRDAIEERNVLQSGQKVRMIDGLTSSCIGELILAKYEVRTITWTGAGDDGNIVGIYQKDGDSAGLYVDSYIALPKIINNFKFNADKYDEDEVRRYLEYHAKLVKPESDQDLIPVNNGILDYRTKQLIPFTPEKVFLRKSAVNYVTGNPPVNPHFKMHDGQDWDFDSWMESLSNDPEIVNLLYMICGAILRPNVRWDKIVCLYAQEGMNGKGTLCELMKQLCGDGFYASIRFVDFAKDVKLAQLLRANAIITDENGTNDYAKDVSNLKAIATGDSISVDRKYKTAITFKYSGLIVECVNNLPRAADQTDSFYRRFLMIPFDKTFKGVERKYIKSDYLHRHEVLEYVLWKVMNLPDYYELPEPEACKSLLAEYKEFNDPVVEFMKDVFSEFVWDKVPMSFVYDLYKAWCNKNNPSGKLISKSSVCDRIIQNLRTLFKGEWGFRKEITRINKDENTEPELMIYEYGLDDWRSKTYKGTDPAKISMPTFKNTYRNVFVRLGSSCDDTDTEEKS